MSGSEVVALVSYLRTAFEIFQIAMDTRVCNFVTYNCKKVRFFTLQNYNIKGSYAAKDPGLWGVHYLISPYTRTIWL